MVVAAFRILNNGAGICFPCTDNVLILLFFSKASGIAVFHITKVAAVTLTAFALDTRAHKSTSHCNESQ